MSSATVHVFVSSTWKDLRPERQAIEKIIHGFRETKFIGMEYFGSRDENTATASLLEVERSHVYVGVLGGRYGSGITEQEYRRAHERKMRCFFYSKQNDTILANDFDNDEVKAARLTIFKADVKQAHTIQEFNSPDDLAKKLATDLHRWLFDEYL